MLAALAHAVALSSALTATSPAEIAPQPAPAAELTVRLYEPFLDRAHEAADAQAVVGRLLAKAGIRVRWVDCSSAPEIWPPGSPCAQPARRGQVILRVLDTSADRDRDCQGKALVPRDGGIGVFATLYRSEVERFHLRTQTSRAEILGHFAAHEIGHLLLGEGHSPLGIMRARWTPRDFGYRARLSLSFTAEQEQRMRTRLAGVSAESQVAEATAQGTNR